MRFYVCFRALEGFEFNVMEHGNLPEILELPKSYSTCRRWLLSMFEFTDDKGISEQVVKNAESKTSGWISIVLREKW